MGPQPIVAWTLAAAFALTGAAGCLGGTDLTLNLGIMMPLTGGLAALGPDMQRGAHLAVEEINAAGLGIQIVKYDEDDKTTASAEAPSTFNRLLGRGVTAVAGPCCSGVTGAVLDLAVQNQIVVASPSATSPLLTSRGPGGADNNQGYFLRISPSDALQGKVLAKLVRDDNVTNANLILVNNAYGNGLGGVFTAHFQSLGGRVGKTEKVDEGASNFASQVDSVCSGTPQAIVLVVYITEGGGILKEMQAKGCRALVKIYASEGVYSGKNSLAEAGGKDALGKYLAEGVKGTNPQSGNSSVYNDKFRARYGSSPAQYSAESYDAVAYLALAALKAKSTRGSDIKANLMSVANGPGEKTNDWKRAAELLKEGADVDWQGFAHDFEFDARQEPSGGIYSIWQVQPDGNERTIRTGVTA